MSMDRLFGKIKQLPTIPQLLHELMQSFNDENARIDEIARVVSGLVRDPMPYTPEPLVI